MMLTESNNINLKLYLMDKKPAAAA